MLASSDITPVPWWEAEPSRFARDQMEVTAQFPDLRWAQAGAGEWQGWLPMWPLDRLAPDGLSDVLGGRGLQVAVVYRQAYPMVPPRIYPLAPRPEPVECTQTRWHVNGDGSLCLYRTETAWDPRGSICDLLVKAAAWRVEYALVKAGALPAMTVNGIVSDPAHDELIADLARHRAKGDRATGSGTSL